MKYLPIALIVSELCSGPARPAEINSVLAHPVFRQAYACIEHGAESLKWSLGDALGTDCFIEKQIEVDGRTWPRLYKDKGERNEDWYGWQEEVLSPCSCEVIDLHVNLVTNSPGVMGKEQASNLKLKRADGVVFVIVHFDKPRAHVGEKIVEGQVIAQVGNNGLSHHPHIHIGAYKGQEPLQIRFDQNFIQLHWPSSTMHESAIRLREVF
jgi:hypothetical protein